MAQRGGGMSDWQRRLAAQQREAEAARRAAERQAREQAWPPVRIPAATYTLESKTVLRGALFMEAAVDVIVGVDTQAGGNDGAGFLNFPK